MLQTFLSWLNHEQPIIVDEIDILAAGIAVGMIWIILRSNK